MSIKKKKDTSKQHQSLKLKPSPIPEHENMKHASTSTVLYRCSKTKRQKSNTFQDQCELSISTQGYYGSVPWWDRQRPGGDLLNKSLENSTERVHKQHVLVLVHMQTQIFRPLHAQGTDCICYHQFPYQKKQPNYATTCNASVKAGVLVTYCMNRYCVSGTLTASAHTIHDSATWNARMKMGCPSITVSIDSCVGCPA